MYKRLVLIIFYFVTLFYVVALTTKQRFNDKKCTILNINSNYTNTNIITIIDMISHNNKKDILVQGIKLFNGENMFVYHDKFLNKYANFDRKYECWSKKGNPTVIYLNNPEKIFLTCLFNIMIYHLFFLFSFFVYGYFNIEQKCQYLCDGYKIIEDK